MNGYNYYSANKHLEILIPVVIIAGMFVFVQSEMFVTYQQVYTKAIAFDLLIGVPLVYILLQKRVDVELYKIIKVFSVCLLLLPLILQDANFKILEILNKVIFAAVKLWVGFKLCQKLYLIFSEYRTHSRFQRGFQLLTTVIQNSFKGRFGHLILMEISVVYFLFYRKRNNHYLQNEYGYTKNRGTKEMVWAFIFIIAIESLVAHILLSKLNLYIALLSTYSSLYLIVLFMSILNSRQYYPISMGEDFLVLRYGFINKSVVSYQDIEVVKKTSLSADPKLMKLSAFKGVESHNVIIRFSVPQVITKVFGIEREYESIGVFVDEPERFIDQLRVRTATAMKN